MGSFLSAETMRESAKMREAQDSLHSYYHLNCLGAPGLLLCCLLLLCFSVVREQKFSLQSAKRIFKDVNIVKYGDSECMFVNVSLGAKPMGWSNCRCSLNLNWNSSSTALFDIT